ncbi:MAG: hemerythrin [Planctomycetaceae bacterium]|jgi:hemerythrin-like domain-containing protein|nr:hemerythrin [Planctomycetaceae bacterium]MBT6155043.1 hemerythrin [Planctomycetaceae bacterium]MBT6485719.1 hemerythrin [Planctomycetaceae bacterium]MBT6496508.1 hemerythrin [Planctomycetaceae bacterium]
MKTIDRLVAEHDLIERGLDLLEKSVALIESNRPVPENFSRWVPDFFSQFADACHHAKEEDLFFPLLKERGISQEGGPIGVMLHEHDIGRDCVRRMREASAADEFDGSSFATAAGEFVPLLRQHIFKENNILFKMAENVLSTADDDALNDRFTEVERERELSELHQQFATEVARWEEAMP